jgi:hypothetical protein
VSGPIFIAGTASTAKTPLRLALNVHPLIGLTRHTELWRRFHGRYGDVADPRNLGRCLDALVRDDHVVRQLAPDRTRVEDELAPQMITYTRVFGVIHRQHAERVRGPRWGEQSQTIERHADEILAAYPDARIIHTVRDARRSARTAGRRPGGIGVAAGSWRESAAWALRNRRRFPSRYRIVRCEELAARPEEVLHELAEFLGVEHHPAMDAAAREGLRGARFAAPPDRAMTALLERGARDELRALGYPVGERAAGRRSVRPVGGVRGPFEYAAMHVARVTHPGPPAEEPPR